MPEVKDPALLQVLNGAPPVAPQQQQSPKPPGVIFGAPKQPDPPNPVSVASENRQTKSDTWSPLAPEEVKSLGLDPTKVWQRNAMGETKAVGDAAKPEATTSPVDTLTRVIDQLDNIYADSADNGGWGETGATGSIMRSVGPTGTAAYDLAGKIQSVNANLAFQELQKMRDNSPTGGALGQVTEQELELLRSTVANLDPNLSQDEFIRQIGIAKGAYLNALEKVDPAKAEEIKNRGTPIVQADGSITYDQRGAAALGITAPDTGPPPDNGGGGGGGGFLGYDSFGQAARDFGMGMGDVVEGAGDVAGIFTNPVGQAWYSALGIDQPYDTGQILRDATGLPQSPDNLAASVGKFGASALAGGGIARAVAPALEGTAAAVANTVGRTPVRDTVAGAGAGAGSYAGKESGIPGGEQIGALAGGMAGYAGANKGMNALMPNVPTATAEAAARQNVDLLPADVGGPAVRGVTSATKVSPISSQPVVKQALKNAGQLSNAARRAAEGQGGEVATTDVAGQNIRKAAQSYTAQTGERATRLYDKAFEQSKGVKIKPLGTLAVMDEQIARAQQSPTGAAVVKELQGYREQLSQGVTVQGLRDMRSALSQGVYDGKLRSGQDVALYKQILGKVADDIDAGLRQAGREDAANLFRRADEFYKARVEHIDQVLEPIIGKDGTKGGEQIVQTIETMARGGSGGNARLSRLLGQMTPEEAGQVRSVIIDRLGKPKPDAPFDPGVFSRSWRGMTPQAKASLFSNTELRRNLDDIALLAEEMRATRAMENHSNTGWSATGNVGAQLALTVSNPSLMLLNFGGQYLTGRLMSSPAFARLLAKSAKLPPEIANRNFGEQLGVLATKEPLIANDVRAVQQFLSDAAKQSPAGLAAQPAQGQNENNGGGIPPQ